MNIAKKIFYILSSLWIMYIFGGSFPYKFSNHEHTQYIFGTIGDWMSITIAPVVGELFSAYGGYVIGIGEVIIFIALFIALVLTAMKKPLAQKLFGFG